MSGQEISQEAVIGLIRAGVSVEAAHRLLSAAAEDERRALVVVALPGEPREGDRLRVKDSPSIQVLDSAPAAGRWAIVGEPVPQSGADDFPLPRGLGRMN